MKIAVQFFGHLRSFRKCYTSIHQHLLDKYDCDVFMHTWSELNYKVNKRKSIPVDSHIIDEINKFYSPIQLKIDDQKDNTEDEKLCCNHNNGKSKVSKKGMRYMTSSMFEVNQLRKSYAEKNHIEYDYIIMIRPDIQLNTDLNLSQIDKEIKITKMKPCRLSACRVPSKMNEFVFCNDLASDILFLSTPTLMDKITVSLKNINFDEISSIIWNPENLYNNELLKQDIYSVPLAYEYENDWNIIRLNQKLPSIKNIFRFKLNLRQIKINLLQIISVPICCFKFRLLFFEFEFNIGKVKNSKWKL